MDHQLYLYFLNTVHPPSPPLCFIYARFVHALSMDWLGSDVQERIHLSLCPRMWSSACSVPLVVPPVF
jgi:hypothetical protein